MGLLFEKVERKKSKKSVVIIKLLVIVVMILCLIKAVMNELDISYLRIVLIAAGVGSIIDGIESYFQKQNKKVYLTEFCLGVLWILFPFLLWNI